MQSSIIHPQYLMNSISIQIKIIRNISRICQVLEMKSIAFLAIIHTRWTHKIYCSLEW